MLWPGACMLHLLYTGFWSAVPPRKIVTYETDNLSVMGSNPLQIPALSLFVFFFLLFFFSNRRLHQVDVDLITLLQTAWRSASPAVLNTECMYTWCTRIRGVSCIKNRLSGDYRAINAAASWIEIK